MIAVGHGTDHGPDTVDRDELMRVEDGSLKDDVGVNVRSASTIPRDPSGIEEEHHVQRILDDDDGEVGDEQVHDVDVEGRA